MRSRNDLAKHFNDLGYKTGVEVGVLGGSYSIKLCEANPNLKLYCVDTWGLGEKRYRDYHLRKFEEAKIRLAPYNCTLIRNYSMEAVRDFTKCSLDFVYIDAKHEFDFVMQDIIEWSKRVRAGGILAGDDYISNGSRSTGVKDAVDMYIKYHPHLNLQVTREDNNWYFIKP